MLSVVPPKAPTEAVPLLPVPTAPFPPGRSVLLVRGRTGSAAGSALASADRPPRIRLRQLGWTTTASPRASRQRGYTTTASPALWAGRYGQPASAGATARKTKRCGLPTVRKR